MSLEKNLSFIGKSKLQLGLIYAHHRFAEIEYLKIADFHSALMFPFLRNLETLASNILELFC